MDEKLFEPLDKGKALTEKELEVLRFWKENDIANRSRKERDKKFGFTEGPPTANGLPHIGHVLTRVVKDVYLRYKTMEGYQIVPNIAGWDTHGLPVEIEVEKELKIDSKEEIQEYGLKEFNRMCKESVFRYEKEWREMSERIGFWIDYDNAYITMEDEYIESVWWSLKKIWEMGLLEEGHKVIPYCPRCGTPLSSHEVAQGWKQVRDPSIYVRFKTKDEDDVYFLAWTTTPWTLISNLLLTVGKDLDYALVEYDGDKYYLAEKLVGEVFEDAEVIKTVKGEELLGKEYEPIFPYVTSPGKSHYVTHADFVSLEEGTGIVHIAPAFGEDDSRLCQEEGVELVNPVDENGEFTDEVKDYAGVFVKDADGQIMTDLYERGDLIKRSSIKHTYPFCWRCDSPLLYYALESWFIRTSKEKQRLIDNNDKVRWKPGHLKHGRFGNFLDELKDWSLSRNRFWGTPLPVWTCPEGHQHCIGSKEELKNMATEPLPDDFELHRPWVDHVELQCPECSGSMSRLEYVIDCWYDSGSAPFAQFHYPFENEDRYQEACPIDFITEALDQTRGWFYSLLAISSLLHDKPAYMSCLTLGLVLDEDGEKMSKSKGNAVSPMEAIDELGSDAIRLYFLSLPVWKSSRFSHELVREKISKTLNTLTNVVSFFVSNANIDEFVPGEFQTDDKLDMWLLSKGQSLVSKVKTNLDDLEVHRATRTIEEFVDDLSNWYLRRSRRRFWEGTPRDKESAYNTLYTSLKTLTLVMAPFTPFITERVYQSVIRKTEDSAESVHLLEFPSHDDNLVDEKLEKHMSYVIKVAELGRNARQKSNIKLRQPLQELFVVTEDESKRQAVRDFVDILKDELNVKELEVKEDASEFMVYSVNPNYSSLGPKFKGDAGKVASLIQDADEEAVVKAVCNEEEIEIGEYTLTPEDFTLEEKIRAGLTLSKGGDLMVFVDTIITDELWMEGLARDVIRRIQTMRKEMDLGYTQIIHTTYDAHPELTRSIEKMKDFISRETLSESLEKKEGKGYREEWDIDGKELILWIDPMEKIYKGQ
ncbi:MAG: isoleucine--tRNA ligase [Thermoplasmata archaeon]